LTAQNNVNTNGRVIMKKLYILLLVGVFVQCGAENSDNDGSVRDKSVIAFIQNTPLTMLSKDGKYLPMPKQFKREHQSYGHTGEEGPNAYRCVCLINETENGPFVNESIVVANEDHGIIWRVQTDYSKVRSTVVDDWLKRDVARYLGDEVHKDMGIPDDEKIYHASQVSVYYYNVGVKGYTYSVKFDLYGSTVTYTLKRETYNGSGDKGELQPDIKDMGSQSDQRVLGGDTQVDLAYDAIVKMETNMGTILIDLYEDRAPKHSANFKKLANEGAFSDTYFHRVIPNFIVQGGDPLTRDNTNRQDDGTGGIGGNIPPEIGQPHLRGTLAAARDNNPEKKSNGSQFYFCLADLPNLDGEYTVFGKIVQGMDIVDEMGSVKTDRRDNPREAIIILNTEVIRK